jgi:hypothetical protein
VSTNIPSSISARATSVALSLSLMAVAFLGFFLTNTSDAEAGVLWCADDPIISVNGKLISVTVNVPFENVRDVASIDTVFHVPSNVHASLVYNGILFPEHTTIVADQKAWDGQGKMKVPVDVTFMSKGKPFPTGVKVLDATGVPVWYDGISNKTTSFVTYGFVRP